MRYRVVTYWIRKSTDRIDQHRWAVLVNCQPRNVGIQGNQMVIPNRVRDSSGHKRRRSEVKRKARPVRSEAEKGHSQSMNDN